jgi:WD40 repeat protein
VSICNLVSGNVRSWRAHSGKIEQLATSPDGRFLATVGSEGIGYVWSVAPGAPRRVAILAGHIGRVVNVAFTPDGKQLATSGIDDCTVRIWDLPEVCHIRK